jgi:hypothetical protein
MRPKATPHAALGESHHAQPFAEYAAPHYPLIFRIISPDQPQVLPGIPKLLSPTNSTHLFEITCDPRGIRVQIRSKYVNTLRFQTLPEKLATMSRQGGHNGQGGRIHRIRQRGQQAWPSDKRKRGQDLRPNPLKSGASAETRTPDLLITKPQNLAN